MDRFFCNEEPPEKQKENEYNSLITECKNKQTLSLLEYSYLLQYWSSGTIVNSNWFINIINKQDNERLCRLIKEKFSNIYKKVKGKNKLKLINTDLTDELIENKKNRIKFNCDQKKVIKEIFKFFPDYTKRAYGSYGYAGTGKTTIIVEILSFLLMKKIIKSVAFTAPTNQALYVIKSKFRPYLKEIYELYFKAELPSQFDFDESIEKLYEYGVKIDFITIHQLLKFEIEYQLKGATFVKNKIGSLISNYEIVIIDECSMIPVNLAEHIFNELRNATKKDSDSYKKIPKIIFLGDKAQLPPVGERISIIFSKSEKNFPFNEYKNIVTETKNTNSDSDHKEPVKSMDACTNTFRDLKKDELRSKYDLLINDIKEMPTRTLEKVMRSKLQEVTDICYQIRLWTLGNVTTPNLGPYIKGGVKAFRYISGNSKLKSEWFEKCLEQHKNGKNYNIILTWTNNQADEYNRAIRSSLFKNSQKIDRFMEGDILMLNKFYNMDDGQISYVGEESTEKKFYTSEQIKVVKVEQIIKEVHTFSSALPKKASKLQNSNHYETKFKQCIDIINNSTKRKYLCWKLTVSKNKDVNDGKKKSELNTIYIVHEKDFKLYEIEKLLIQAEIKKLSTYLTSKFKDKAQTIETNIIKPLIKDFYKNMDEPFADVSYGYAITCHKGQGSNFYNTFVDVDDILKNIKCDEHKHCLYTAVTRTSNELYLLVKHT